MSTGVRNTCAAPLSRGWFVLLLLLVVGWLIRWLVGWLVARVGWFLSVVVWSVVGGVARLVLKKAGGGGARVGGLVGWLSVGWFRFGLAWDKAQVSCVWIFFGLGVAQKESTGGKLEG